MKKGLLLTLLSNAFMIFGYGQVLFILNFLRIVS